MTEELLTAIDLCRQRAEKAEARVATLEAERGKLREIAGYVRAHLAGNDADPELRWALNEYDEWPAAGSEEQQP